MGEKELKQVGDFKMYFQQGVSKNGEKAFLTYTANPELKDILKRAIINEVTEFIFSGERDEQSNRIEKKIKRYKVKKVIYTALYSNYKDLLFIKDFIDKGVYTLDFSSMDTLEQVKETLKSDLRNMLKILVNMELEQTTIFKINRE